MQLASNTRPITTDSTTAAGWAAWRWAAAVFGACLAAALVSTWPLPLYLTSAIPLGTEREATVPLLNLWTLWWNADRAAQGFRGYWDAPIFSPNPGTFSYSEPQPLIGLLAAPLWALGAPVALIYNLALLALVMLNGIFAYRLARALAVPSPAALLGAVLVITLPFSAKVLGVLPVVGSFGMLWTLEGLVRFSQTGRLRQSLWAAGGLLATGLSAQQYALIFLPFVLPAYLLALAQQRWSLRTSARLGVPALVAALALLLQVLPALTVHAQQGLSRSEQLVQLLSARPADFLSRPETALVDFPARAQTDTGGLFPGLLLTLLGLVGFIVGQRRPGPRRRWTRYLAGGALLALVLALGLNLTVAGWQPFASVRALIPGLATLRSPFRFGVITQLYLAMLAGVGLAALRQRLAQRGSLMLLAVGLLAAVENLAVPVPLAGIPAHARTGWSAWLRAQSAPAVIAHVPFPAGTHVRDYELETWRMLAQTDHHQPMVNGYSGYFPHTRTPDGRRIPSYTQFQLAMARQFPSYELLCVLDRALQVRYLVVDRPWLNAHSAELAAFQPFLQPAYADQQVQIYELEAPPGECQAQ